MTPRPAPLAIDAEELPVEMSEREKFLLDMNGNDSPPQPALCSMPRWAPF